MLKTEAIEKFLHSKPYQLAKLYSPCMEVQVNVAKEEGEIITGSYAGKQWQGYTNGLVTWKSFRIPWQAGTDPKYEDKDIRFDISKYAEAIGMTGWDYINKKSRWVGYDFDSIIGHKEGLDDDELQEIQKQIASIPWCSLYTSTGGFGIHIYVFLDSDYHVANHSEHSAIAKAILAKMSGLSGIKLESKVDAFGSNMWVWHRKAIPGKSLQLIKRGTILEEIPPNWQEYTTEVSRKVITPKKFFTNYDLLIASQHHIQLDDEHKRLIDWFEKQSTLWWWDSDKYMLVCHTYDLKRAHGDLRLKGFFDTVSEGKEAGNDQNCFCFPAESGSWNVRRHTRGVTEHPSWFIDSSGWTTCFYNKLPSLRLASRQVGGIEGEKDFNFKTLEEGRRTLLIMGFDLEIPPNCSKRECSIKQTENKIVISFTRREDDDELTGWVKKKDTWQKIFFRHDVTDDVELPDNLIRHVTASSVDLGWFIFTNNGWVQENPANVKSVLKSTGVSTKDLDFILGKCILNNWILTMKPFKPEYPGNREWNRSAPQFKYNPETGEHPHWDIILNHCGQKLDEAVLKNDWCIEHGITSGYLYLLSWITALFKDPEQPLPYLVLYGEQNTGKSIFHEALNLLVTTGIVRADHALTNSSGFNGELANAILCVVEETNLAKTAIASDRIKDWVTGRYLSIHPKRRQPYDLPNYTHWVQCTNDPSYCPILPGDTRIVLIEVNKIEQELPKPLLLQKLDSEAPAFISTVFDFELPPSPVRLRIPILETKAKETQETVNRSPVMDFMEEHALNISGAYCTFEEFYVKFCSWVGPDAAKWSKRRMSFEVKKLGLSKGRYTKAHQVCLGNITFNPQVEENYRLVEEEGYLVEKPI